MTQEKGAGYYEKQYYFGMCGDRGKTLFDQQEPAQYAGTFRIKKIFTKVAAQSDFS